METKILLFLIDFVVSACSYMFIPACLCVLEIKLSEGAIKLIVFINSAVVWLIFKAVQIECGIYSNSMSVFLWSVVSLWLLMIKCSKDSGNVHKQADSKKNSTKTKQSKQKETNTITVNVALWELLCAREKQFEKAKTRRMFITILAFATCFFVLICIDEKPTGLEYLATAIVSIVFAGIHVLINAAVFGALFRASESERKALDYLRKQLSDQENDKSNTEK